MTKVRVSIRKASIATPAHALNTRGTPGGTENLPAQGLTAGLLQQNSNVAHVLSRLTNLPEEKVCQHSSMNNIYLLYKRYLPSYTRGLVINKRLGVICKDKWGKNSTLKIQSNDQNQVLTNVFSMLKALMEK